jgi:cytoplasmic iron level regulating protein YaaA (DUF328/UPF0246 family)
LKILISPAKSLNFDVKPSISSDSEPKFLSDSKILVSELKKFSQDDIAKMMNISQNLAKLNFERYKNFTTPFTKKNAKAAIFVFNGDVYDGIEVEKYQEKDFDYLQENLRILSGLYGILKPLDLMQAYRLEMSTKLKNPRGKNLYEFWQDKITNFLNEEEGNLIVNLASEEYFKSINQKKLKAKLLNINFYEKKNEKYKIIGIFAKKARGTMVHYLTKNKVENIEKIKEFNLLEYKFNDKMSDENNFSFCR